MTIRRLFAQPFRNYANFSGRSGRMEFWLFILTFTVITQGSALVASGLATLVTDDRLQEKPYHRLEHHELWHRWHDENARITFMIHRHDDSTRFHLHGMVNPETGNPETGNPETGNPDNPEGKPQHSGGFSWRHDHGHHRTAEKAGQTLWLLSTLLLLIPLMAVSARRLHDSNHSGWWQLMVTIPLAGWLVLLIFMLLPSDGEENRYRRQ